MNTLYTNNGDTTTRSEPELRFTGTLAECQDEAVKYPDTGDGWNSCCWIEDESGVVWDRDFPIN